MTNPTSQVARDISILLVGVGAIGSHLAQHLGRTRGIGEVILVDPDYYDLANLYHQAITLQDPGLSKVEAQARRLAEINPELEVESIASPVEQVPRGLLRCDVILSCLDSRRSRQHVNLIARRLGIPWIDAGVEAGSRLVRISTYFPGEEQACMECHWDERDYQALERVFACNGGRAEVAPTGAPSSLGALAASLQALELADLLNGRLESSSPARQVILDAAHHKVLITTFRRNPGCRVADHGVWNVEKLESGPEQLTLADALLLAPDEVNANPANGLRVEGSMFVNRLNCSECGFTKDLLRLEVALGQRDLRCPECGKELVAPGFHKVERLLPTSMPELQLDMPLSDVGLRRGDLISVGVPGNERHLEMGGGEND